MTLIMKAATGLMVCFAAVHVVLGCSGQDMISKLNKCHRISVDELTTESGKEKLSAFCSNVECNIKCFIDAVGNCYTQDQFFHYNPDIEKVTSRALCNNQEDTLSALNNCQWSDATCPTAFKTAVINSLTKFTRGDYAAFKSEYCNALEQVLLCLGFTTSATCTAALADGLKSGYEATYSYTSCGIAQHPLATTYGGDVTCGGSQFHQSVAITVLITVTLALLI